ncbi:MAG: threonine efflux protein [Cryomorphaceae bacterium]|jgi:threonine efflux protein
MIEWLTFFMIMAVGQFSPGPDMVLLTRVSLAEGKRAGWATACGIACGLMIHAGIAVSGLAFVLAKNETFYRWIKYLACGYLLWLAYKLMRSSVQKVRFKLDSRPATRPQTSLVGYWKMGFLCNILNPKVAIFLAGVTLPFLGMGMNTDLEIGDSAWAVLLWATIFLEGWLLWSIWVWLLQHPVIKNFYRQSAHVIDGVFGLCLIALAVMLVLS